MSGTPEVFEAASIDGLSVADVINRRAVETPEQVFLIDAGNGHAITYATLQSSARSFAARLVADGFAAGESIAYAMENGANAARVILGGLYGGYLTTAINLVSGAGTISYVLGHSEAKVVFVDAKTGPQIRQIVEGMQTQPRIVDIDETWFEGSANVVASSGNTQDGLLMYTSGTTGVPKGVVLTHANLLAGGSNTAVAHELTAQDRAMCVLPLYHINGLCVTLMGPLVSGGSVVMPQKFSVSTFWNHMRTNGTTWFSVVPTQISYLLHNEIPHDRNGLEQLRFGRSASAPLSPDVQSAFEEKFAVPIIETMGLTETAAQILSNPLPPGTRKIGSPGVAVGNEVLIADEQQREMPRGEEGEVIVRGANVMRLYRNNDDATQSSLTADAWLRTGDLGRMDEDGYVFITGRLKELIIKGGENIAPREIDDVLYSHPDVIEAAAFARACNSYGQTVEAGVKVTPGTSLTESDLLTLCRDTVGAFKTPDRIHFLSDLPKGPSGKIQRMKLAEMAADS